MIEAPALILAALLYLGLLFGIASFGDRKRPSSKTQGRPTIYALSLGVYCTSWTFFGSVGLAATSGFGFFTVYIGPILVWVLGAPLIRWIVRLSKLERITSIADFLAARYGKSQIVAAGVTVIAVVATLPYIALQLKAVSDSVAVLLSDQNGMPAGPLPVIGDLALVVALLMAVFAILFGTRHADATEHQEGLMLAVAAESVVKLACLLLVGIYVTFGLYDGPAMLWQAAAEKGATAIFARDMNGGTLIAQVLLSAFAILLLPRQFHVTVVENNAAAEIKRARWMFPLYLLLINLFVVPLALAGLAVFGDAGKGDLFVLMLPLEAGHGWMTLAAFIGGLSAATAMVIVASVALAIMISNDLVIPLLLRQRFDAALAHTDMSALLLTIRRTAIFALMLSGYVYYRMAGNSAALATIGFLSFAAIAQLAPAFLLGLIWRRATARGAIAGMGTGFLVWIYTMLLPALAEAGLVSPLFIAEGPFGIGLLRPENLFNIAFEPLAHGVFWSLTLNTAALVIVSMLRGPRAIDRAQAAIFVPNPFTPAPSYRLWRTSVTIGDLLATVGRYIGDERAERSFERFAEENRIPLDPARPATYELVRFSEQLLASAIGAASSRLVMSLLLKRREPAARVTMKLLDDASEAIQYSRDLMQVALDQVAQGIGVFDRELRLICWNRRFRDLLGLPVEFGTVGTQLTAILTFHAERGLYGPGEPQDLVSAWIGRLTTRTGASHEIVTPSGMVLDMRASEMPGGGLVLTATDVTERVLSERALARANETLEGRVRERTEALVELNDALTRAKAAADQANLDKTRFFAAASHDILQPLNAARLYATSFVERYGQSEAARFVANIDQSLESVEDILSAVLDIARLDTGALKPEFTLFRLEEIFEPLALEFEPLARDKGIRLRFVRTSASVRSDRRLLRRLLQNLISNAIKYTAKGSVLVGCRRAGGRLSVRVYDTGIGIPARQQKLIFQEFQRLDEGARIAPGLGLGLSIVERIGRVLDHPVSLRSKPGQGSVFSVELPLAPTLPKRNAALPRQEHAPADLTGLKVLVIDNEPRILEGMKLLLSGWGCRVILAQNSKQALAALQTVEDKPDILLVDYHLGDGTGIDAAIALRWRLGQDLPAALLTANRSPDVKEAALAKGMTVLYKPVKPASLRALLSQSRVAKVTV